MIPAPVQRALERLVEEDLRGATITSCSVNVSESGRITLDEIILRRQDRSEVAIGLGGMRPDGTHSEPAIVIDIYDAPKPRRSWTIGGWREMTIVDDLREELDDLSRIWRAGDDADRPEDRA